jgi:hypothetical protein
MVSSVEEDAWSAIHGKHRTICLRALSSKVFAAPANDALSPSCCIGSSCAIGAAAIYAIELRSLREEAVNLAVSD